MKVQFMVLSVCVGSLSMGLPAKAAQPFALPADAAYSAVGGFPMSIAQAVTVFEKSKGTMTEQKTSDTQQKTERQSSGQSQESTVTTGVPGSSITTKVQKSESVSSEQTSVRRTENTTQHSSGSSISVAVGSPVAQPLPAVLPAVIPPVEPAPATHEWGQVLQMVLPWVFESQRR